MCALILNGDDGDDGDGDGWRAVREEKKKSSEGAKAGQR